MQNEPKPYEIYRHFKGKMYQVLNIAVNSEDGSRMVVYQQLYSPYQVYVRPYQMFISQVDRVKYPMADQIYRFQLVEPDSGMDIDRTIVQNKKDEPVSMQNTIDSGDETAGISPVLMSFLDADTYERKLEILSMMHQNITQEDINTIAASLDVEVEAGELETRYDAVKNCLVTLERFECNRLR